jgi:hypothetical protein
MAARPFTQTVAGASRWFAELIAAVLVGGYLLACLLLYVSAGDARWDNRIKIFEALAPLVGLAVGWIFGKEVHRQEAADAKHAAVIATRVADKGHELAGGVRVVLANYPRTADDKADAGQATSMSSAATSSILFHLASLANEADRLFPPQTDDPGRE